MIRFLKTVGFLFLVTFALFALLITAAYAAGTVWVSVQQKNAGGHHIVVAVPAVLVPIGLDLAPQDKLQRASAEAQQWLPAVDAASKALAQCPDARLVEVRSRSQFVEVVKRGDSLIVDVDSPDARVHVTLPLVLVHSVAEKLESFHSSV